MNQKLQSGLAAALLITTLGTASSTHADPIQGRSQPSQTKTQAISSLPSASSKTQSNDVIKVGEHQSQRAVAEADAAVIAKIQPHVVAGRSAATLYVRNIPVLTFLGSDPVAKQGTKVGKVARSRDAATTAVKVASNQDMPSLMKLAQGANADNTTDPVWRATAVAAKLNQLNRDNVDANTITANWDTERDRYLIKVKNEALVALDDQTVLPDTTHDLAKDALQATNRLRRQLGNAAPLQEISGKPKPKSQQISLGLVQLRFTGLASWYGPGFHGNRSASGERFNQNALTAAHRNLPFGTQVQVTNLDNGRSVVVRINDRGPYARGRVIDLSAAAARILGLVQSGVAPVRLDVLNQQQEVSIKN